MILPGNFLPRNSSRFLFHLIPFLIAWGSSAWADTVTWNVDADGQWHEGANWSTGSPPGPDDDVVIDRAAGLFTITVSLGDQYAGTITCAENLAITGGILTVGSTVQVDGEFSLSAATLTSAIVQSTLDCSGTAGQLDQVTINGGLTLGKSNNTFVYIYNGLTLNGTAYVGWGSHSGRLSFFQAQTLEGTGEVVFSDNEDNGVFCGTGVLTIGPNILIHGVKGKIQDWHGFVNQGTIRAETTAGRITLDGIEWRNDGIIEATWGGALVLEGLVTTADLGDFRASGGITELIGILDNTGDVLELNGVTGSIMLDGGTIRGGTVAPGLDLAKIFYRGIRGKLDGVVMDADMIVSQLTLTHVEILNGLTLNGKAYLGWTDNYGRLEFQGSQTLIGTGEVIFGSYPGHGALYCPDGTLTIGPDITVHGARGLVFGSEGFVNEGLIRSDEAIGGYIALSGDGWRNEGLIEATAGGALSLAGRVTTSDLGDWRGTDGRVALDGILDNTAAVLELDGMTGPLVLDDGTIQGGTVAPGTGGARIFYEGGSLDGVVMNDDVILGDGQSATLSILNGFTLNGTVFLGSTTHLATMAFAGNQIIEGSGEILFGNQGNNTILGNPGTLTFGPQILIHGATGRFRGGADFVNLGTILADGSEGILEMDGASWTNMGTLESAAGILDIKTPLNNTGLVHVEPHSRIDSDDLITQTMGTTQVDSGGIMYSTQTIEIQGGELTGFGLTGSTLINSGRLLPGASTGTFSHSGNFYQAEVGTLGIELGGVEHGLFDRLLVFGTANLDGILEVDWVNNFTPAAGDSFVIMEFISRSGTFAVENFPDLPPGLTMVADYGTESLVLRVVGSVQYPTIQQITDVPADQGGFVDVSWNASPLDDPGEPDPITSYEVQRFGTAWETVGTVPALGNPLYATTVATPDILTLGEPEPWGYFRILALTATPGVFYSSPSDSGYSIDNLAPPPPILILTEDLDSRVLSWTYNDVSDLGVTCLYRVDAFGVLPDTLLLCTPESSWTETHQFYYNYYAQGIDIHGNPGEFSNVVEYVYPSDVAESLPTVPVLAQNYPNPFNPSTLIHFDLPRRMDARLVIYSLDGKRLVTLASGLLDSGSHDFYWYGRDDAGRDLAAGVYFFRLETGSFRQTRSMTLLK